MQEMFVYLYKKEVIKTHGKIIEENLAMLIFLDISVGGG